MNEQKHPPSNSHDNDTRSTTYAERAKNLAESDLTDKGQIFEELVARGLKALVEHNVKDAWVAAEVPREIRRKFWRDDHTPTGIDVLALKHDGNFIAVQCKCYKLDRRLNAAEVKDVVSNAKQLVGKTDGGVIDQIYVVATVDPGEGAIGWEKGVTFINVVAEWDGHLISQKKPTPPKKLDTLQREAFEKCIHHYSNKKGDAVGKGQSRGKLIMACGTGKTLVSQRVAESKEITPGKGIVLYATPSILLTGQSQISWMREKERPMASMVVCSDSKSGSKGDKDLDISDERAHKILGKVTTDPAEIAAETKRLLDGLPEGGMMVIFTLYQSMGKVVDAQRKHGLPEIDFAIADEAHRTAGKWKGAEGDRDASPYLLFHENMRAKKRMYQTATPRIYSKKSHKKFSSSTMDFVKNFDQEKIVDMSLAEVFGGEIHNLSFRKALTEQKPGEERLCDYKIVIAFDSAANVPEGLSKRDIINRDVEDFKSSPLGGGEGANDRSKKDDFLDLPSQVSLVALMNSLAESKGGVTIQVDKKTGKTIKVQEDDRDIRSCIGFANRVSRAQMFAEAVNRDDVQRAVCANRDVKLSAGEINGNTRDGDRKIELDNLVAANKKENDSRHVTFSVRVLSEGVDVPSLDSVAFLDPRQSEIDIVQAVGRVMRRPPGSNKKTGYIIVPVGMDKFGDGEVIMAGRAGAERWSILGQVLLALRSHDKGIDTKYPDVIVYPEISPTPIGSGDGDGKGPSPTPPDPPGPIDIVRSTRSFIAELLTGDFTGIKPDAMPKTGVMQGVIQSPKTVMQRMVGRATYYLHKEKMGQQLMKCTDTDPKSPRADLRACQFAALHLSLCGLMHQRLVETRANQPKPIPYLKPLRECVVEDEIGDTLLDQWEAVLNHDFRPIFAPGIAVLEAMRVPGRTTHSRGAILAMEQIAEDASEYAEKYADIGADEAGEIFQASMDDEEQKEYSANYTLPVAGVLLAEMTCDAYASKDDSIWSNPQYWREHAILDPACGSGTLLVAMMSAIVRRAKAQGADDKKIIELRQVLIEDSLTGLDVNKWALQLAATQMAISVGSAPLCRMGFYNMPLLDDRGYPMLGSLELLLFNKGGSIRSLSETRVRGESTDLGGANSVVDSHEGLMDRMSRVDICIANPPFGAVKARQKNMTEEMKEEMKKRKKYIQSFYPFAAGRNPLKGASNSLNPWFTLLMANTGCRIMSRVTPQTALVSTASDEPNFIRDNYDMVESVTSHESVGYPSWSAGSQITESMQVFKCKMDASGASSQALTDAPPPPPPPPQRFTSVIKRPEVNDAVEIERWDVSTFTRDHGSDWWHSSFCHVNMHASAEEIVAVFRDGQCWVSLGDTHDKNVLKVNETSRQYRSKTVNSIEGQIPVLRGTGQSHDRLALKPNACVVGLHPSKVKDAGKNKSTLLHAKSFNPVSARLHAAHVGMPCIGVDWVPLVNASQEESKGLSVFLNSTIHRVNLLMCFSENIKHPLHEPKAIKSTFVPNIWDNPKMLKPLVDAYEKTNAMEVSRFDAGYTEIRQIWDRAVAEAIRLGGGDITYEKIKFWAEALAEEPLVKPSKKQMK